MEQFNKLIEFRQMVYEQGFSQAKDAQFELVDALLVGQPLRSFPELSLLPVFRRQWPSAYAAIEDGGQDREWLEDYFVPQLPARGPLLFSLDGTAWPHAAARVLTDLQYVYSPTAAVTEKSIVVGHPYSVLAWVPERGRSWVGPVSIRRVPSHQSDIDMGVAQVQQLCQQRATAMLESLHLIIADANHRFLGALREEPCGALVRLRRDRVLYGPPPAYQGRGRPRIHGARRMRRRS